MYLPLRGTVGPMRTDFDIDLRAVSKAKLGQPLWLDRVSYLSCGSGIHAGRATSAR